MSLFLMWEDRPFGEYSSGSTAFAPLPVEVPNDRIRIIERFPPIRTCRIIVLLLEDNILLLTADIVGCALTLDIYLNAEIVPLRMFVESSRIHVKVIMELI